MHENAQFCKTSKTALINWTESMWKKEENSDFAVVCAKLNKMRANDQVYVNKPKFRLFLKNSIWNRNDTSPKMVNFGSPEIFDQVHF